MSLNELLIRPSSGPAGKPWSQLVAYSLEVKSLIADDIDIKDIIVDGNADVKGDLNVDGKLFSGPFSSGTNSAVVGALSSGAITAGGSFSSGTNTMQCGAVSSGSIAASGTLSCGTNAASFGAASCSSLVSSGTLSCGTNSATVGSLSSGAITSSGAFSCGTNSMVSGAISSRSLALSAQPIMIVRGTGVQSIANSTGTTVTYWNTTSLLQGGMLYSAGVCTVPVAGVYLLSASVEFSAPVGDRGLWFLLGGATMYANNYVASPTAGGSVITASAPVSLLANGTVEVQVYQLSGGPLDISNGFAASLFSVSLMF